MITDIIKQARELLENIGGGHWRAEMCLQAEEHYGYPAVIHTNIVDDSYTFAVFDQLSDLDKPIRMQAAELLAFARNNLAAILDEVERLRDALKFYADETPGIRVEKAVPNGASCFMVIDRGQIARKALEGEG